MTVTFNPNPETELGALNSMLLSIGRSPVNTTSVPGVNAVSNAMTILYQVVREVQGRRWWFNWDTKYPIVPDVNGNIIIPNDAIQFAPSRQWRNYVERYNPAVSAMCLWDMDDQTFNLTTYLQNGSLLCDIQWCFAFEQVPQVARVYMARRAGRIFQTSAVGSQLIYQFTKEMELDAAAELERTHLRFSRTNWFNTANQSNRAVNRQPGAYVRPW